MKEVMRLFDVNQMARTGQNEEKSMSAVLKNPAANPDPATRWVDVSPELAAEWMARNSNNRPKKVMNIGRFTATMLGGGWLMTGQPIQFGKSGRLVDGQNRLQAIINSGISVRLLVVDGVDDAVFSVIDSGAKRTVSDTLHIEGFEGWLAQCGATAAGIAMDMLKGRLPYSNSPQNQDALKFVQENEGLMQSVGFLSAVPRKVAPLPHSAGAALHFLMAKKNAVLADSYICHLYSGRDIDGMVLNLRNNLLARSKNEPAGRHLNLKAIGAVIKVWNALRAGRQIKHIGNAFVGSDEAFPLIN